MPIGTVVLIIGALYLLRNNGAGTGVRYYQQPLSNVQQNKPQTTQPQSKAGSGGFGMGSGGGSGINFGLGSGANGSYPSTIHAPSYPTISAYDPNMSIEGTGATVAELKSLGYSDADIGYMLDSVSAPDPFQIQPDPTQSYGGIFDNYQPAMPVFVGENDYSESAAQGDSSFWGDGSSDSGGGDDYSESAWY